MREETEAIRIFTPEMLETMAYIWTRSSISLMDVRHKYIEPKHPLQHYKMPSSMLVYAYGGTAHVQLNEADFAMERFGLFHGRIAICFATSFVGSVRMSSPLR